MTRPSGLMRTSIAAAIGLLATIGFAANAMCQASQRDIDALSKASLIYIATVRKDGNQSNAAPVWFTTTPDHIVLINTAPDSWKAKRIRRGSPAMIWIGDANGPAFIAKAEITNDAALQNRVIEDYPQKYLTARVGLFRPTKEKYDAGKSVVIKIQPIRDLPDGFTSQPGTPAPSLTEASANPVPSAAASPGNPVP
jgi:general stress protein 26